MPELPEVETVVRELNRKLHGKKISDVSVLLGKIVAVGPQTLGPKRHSDQKTVNEFARLLRGRKILSVTRRAKMLIFNLAGPLSLLVHLKMTGQFIYLRKAELHRKVRVFNKPTAPLISLPAKQTHVVFRLSDGSKLYYNDLRQFGFLKVVTDAELPNVRDLAGFGPEPLAKSFTFPAFELILKRRPNMTVKQFLLDPTLVAGIGNIYSDEILFRAKVRPMRRVKSLSGTERKKVFLAIPFILKKGIAARGSSVGDFVRTDGSWGNMGKYHFVYARAGKPCLNCGTIIKSIKFSGRTGSYCPQCQR